MPRTKPKATIDGVAWEDLAVLLASLDHRSLNQASSALQIGQSTASRRITRLEERLGGRLFDRVPEGLRPTQLALDIEPHARRIETNMADIERLAAGQGQTATGRVRLAVPDGLASAWLIPELPHFYELHPNIELSLLESQSIADLLRREADMALRLVAPTEPSLVSLKLGTLSLQPYAHPSIAEGPASPQRWVMLDDPQREFVESRWIGQHIRPQRTLVVSQWQSMISALQTGLGAGLVNATVAKRAGLLPLPGNYPPGPTRTLYLVCHPSMKNVVAVAVVRAWLVQVTHSFFATSQPPPDASKEIVQTKV